MSTEDKNRVMEKMKSIKLQIEKFIEQGRFNDAIEAIDKYEKIVPDDIDICSMRAIILIMENDFEKAKKTLLEGLKNDSCIFDLLFNLAYVYEQEGNYKYAAEMYLKAGTVAETVENSENVSIALERVKSIDTSILFKEKKKLVFFVKRGMDSFIGDIINGLSEEYWTRKIIVDSYIQIDKVMEWADVCWFEWCDELIGYGSKTRLAQEKRIICRIHGYEVYSDLIKKPDWRNVNKLIIVAPHIKRLFIENIKDILKSDLDINMIFCGVNLQRYTFKTKVKGFNIGYLGHINFKKNIPLTLEIFKCLHEMDHRYKLFLAGDFQDSRTYGYFKYFIDEYNLQDCVIFEGWKDEVSKKEWLSKIDYMLISSIDEGLCYAAAEAMSCGIKPILHSCEGLKDHYDKKYIFNSINEAVQMIESDEYNSIDYRRFIENKFSSERELSEIKQLLSDLLSKKTIIECVEDYLSGKEPVNKTLNDVTILMPCYNRAKMIKEDLDKGLKLGNQTKLIIDDCSTQENSYLDEIENNKEIYNVNIIRKKNNEGLALARWTGLNNIQTKYTAFVDDDDMLFCFDRNIAMKDVAGLDNEILLVVPRYLINLYDNNSISVGYDRQCYNGRTAEDVLKQIAAESEIKALLAGGSIGTTEVLKKFSFSKMFRVAEDFVMLARLMASNRSKKIRITESLVHIRRINNQTLSGTLSLYKMSLCLLSQAIACYYCLKLKLATKEEVFKWMKDRSLLIQKIYNFGESFETELIAYLKGEVSEEVFIHFLALHDIKLDNGLDELAPELPQMRSLIYNEPPKKDLFAEKSKEDLPLVSIIIPTFNRKDMLRRAIDQALKQDYPNIEVIVTDNCSEDGTKQMVESEYKDRKGLVYNYNKKNLGAIGNYHNAFYNIAKGKYCLTTSDDDYLVDSCYISKAVEILEEHNDIAFVFANEYHNNENSGKVYKIDRKMPRIIDGVDLFLNFTSEKYPSMPNINNVILRTSNAKKINYLKVNPNCLAGDLSMLLRLLLTGNAGFIDNTVLVYTLHKSSISLNVDACLPDDITVNDKAVEIARTDIDELIKVASLAHELKRIDSKVLDEWLNFRIWKYMYYRINESAKNISECESLLSFINNKFPKLYSSLNNVAMERFGI